MTEMELYLSKVAILAELSQYLQEEYYYRLKTHVKIPRAPPKKKTVKTKTKPKKYLKNQ